MNHAYSYLTNSCRRLYQPTIAHRFRSSQRAALVKTANRTRVFLRTYNRRVAVKREGTGAGDLYINELATILPPCGIEHHNFVAARPARHPRRIFLARPFDENLRLPPHKCTVSASGDFVDDIE